MLVARWRGNSKRQLQATPAVPFASSGGGFVANLSVICALDYQKLDRA